MARAQSARLESSERTVPLETTNILARISALVVSRGGWNGRYLKPGAQFMSSTAMPPPAQTRLHHFIRMKKSS